MDIYYYDNFFFNGITMKLWLLIVHVHVENPKTFCIPFFFNKKKHSEIICSSSFYYIAK